MNFFKFKTFFSKILLGYILVISIVLIVLQALFYQSVENFYLKNLTQNLTYLSKSLELKFKDDFLFSKEDLDKIIKQFGLEIDTRITLIDKNGKVIADSKKEILEMENHYDREEILKSLSNEIGVSTRFSTTTKQDMHYVSRAIHQNGEVIGFIRVSLFVYQVNDFLNSIKANTYYILLGVSLLAFLGSVFIAKSLSKPVRLLKEASEKIGKGDFSTTVIVGGNSEISDLASSFNEMTRRIKGLFSELKKDREELNSILFSVKEGIMVIEEGSGKILLANDKIKHWSKYEQLTGLPYWKVIKSKDFQSYVKEVWQTKTGRNIELIIEKKHYLCSASYLPLKRSLVAVFFDVSEQRKLEKEKRDFVSNVSHELRTPLTSIKGFIETLMQSEAGKNEKRYLHIIHRNSERLISMVADLLALSKLESDDNGLDLENIKLNYFLENIKSLFQKKTHYKGLAFELAIKDDLEIKADAYMLEQVLINLLDNAVKYTEVGYVKLFAKERGNNFLITIEDSGIGIANKQKNRIFERFYVVDKSRSRNLGGTGLGLSIVKHIIMLHGWEINVHSILGKGTTFEIVIPKIL